MVHERPSIAVLGTLTRDTTTYADGSRTENLGGLLYTLATLVHLFDGGARILPVANVGADFHATVRAALDLPGIDPQLLRSVPVPNNHVHLTYRDDSTRDEILSGLVPPIELDHATGALATSWMLINLTSGRDIELGTLQALRARFRGVVQLDIHSLTLDIAAGGLRVLRRPDRWREWVACADWVQMNETEAALLGDGAPPEEFAEQLLDAGPQGALVTLGSAGCLGSWREGGAVRRLRLPAAHHPSPPYPTGCGDVFGATFAYARLAGAAVEDALRLANGVAGVKAGFEPHARLRRIRELAVMHLRECFAGPPSRGGAHP
jgi:sugar/nucleoside kinase (ribokinase family)